MWFLFKCLIVFALFYLIFLAEERGKTPVAGARPPPTAVAKPNPVAERDGALVRLRRAASDELIAAARQKCFAHPMDCAAALQFAGEGAVSAPRRR